MEFVDKIKRGLRSLKWAVSENGREYRKNYKIDKESMEVSYEKTNYHKELKKDVK